MQEMAASKCIVVALFLVFALLAATLQPSEAIRVQVVKPKEDQETSSAVSTNGGDVARPSTWPGFPGIPSLPLLPFPSFPPVPPLPGCPPLPPVPRFPGKPPHSGPPSLPGSPLPSSPPSSPASPPPPPMTRSPSSPVGTPPPPSQPTECLSSLMGLMPCMDYLTNTSAPAPPSTCCDGFKTLINSAPICLCHGMNGDINSLMPAPIDFMRMMSLPAACGVALPLQTLAMCSTTPVPPLMPAPTPAAAPSSEPSP